MKWKNWDRNLKVRLIGEFVFNLLFWMFFPFMAMYFSEELGKTVAGLLLVVSQAISVLFNLVGGYFADTYGRRKMMLFAGWGQVISIVIMTIGTFPNIENPYIVFIGFSCLGIMSSLYMPASQAMVADVVEEKNRNSVFAIFYTAVNISVVVGPLIGGVMFFTNRFLLMVLATIASILILIFFQKYIKETLPKHNMTVKATSTMQFFKMQVRNYKLIFKDGLFFLFIVAGILAAQTYMQMDLLLSVYIHETVDKVTFSFGQLFSGTISGDALFSYVIAENGLIVACFTVIVTTIVGRYKEKWMFVLSALLYSFSMVVFAHSFGLFGFIIGMAIFTLGEIVVVGIQNGFVAKIAPEEMRGQYFAAASLRFSIGRTLAPLAIPLTSLFGFQGTFYFVGGITIVAAIVYYFMFTLFEKRENLQKKAA